MTRMLRSALRLPSAKIAVGVLVVIAILAVFGPLVAPLDPYLQDTKNLLQGPSAAHWLGTDDLGRDVFSRLLAGSTVSVVAALQSVLIGLGFGALPGLLSVYLGRGFEWVTLRIMDSFITLPFLVFAIAMTALLGNGLGQAMFAVGILIAPAFYRVTRAATLAVAHAPYVEAARLQGASTVWIVRTHVWRKVFPAVAVTTASMTGASLVIVASLTFLGIGIEPPEPTWGGLLATDLGNLYQRPFGPVVPALVIIATVWALNALADAMKDGGGVPVVGIRSSKRRRAAAAAAGGSDAGDAAEAKEPAHA
jgi:peptide/nickel transport system permease protein